MCFLNKVRGQRLHIKVGHSRLKSPLKRKIKEWDPFVLSHHDEGQVKVRSLDSSIFQHSVLSTPIAPIQKSTYSLTAGKAQAEPPASKTELHHPQCSSPLTDTALQLTWMMQGTYERDLLFSSLTISLCWNASLPTNNLGGSGKWSCGVSENSRALFRFCHAIIKRLPLGYGTDLSKPVNNAFLLVESLWLPTKEKPVVY